MRFIEQKSLQHTLYVFVLLLVAYLYGYHTELLMRPNSFHVWRQCDGAQIAMNYYNVSMNFFEPRLNVLMGNDGKMVSEFPIIYYSAACLYHVFGPHEFFIRLICVSLFFIGLLYLFKTLRLLMDDWIYAFLLSLIPFTSAVVSDYGISFLPDVPALSLSFIGYYYFLKFIKQKKRQDIYMAAFFFSLTGLLKVTSLIGFFALGAVLLFCFLFMRKSDVVREYIPYTKHLVLMLLIPVFVTSIWILYADHYNATNHNTYFLMKPQPMWDADTPYILTILHRFEWQWLRMYLYRDFLHVLPFIAIGSFLFLKNSRNKPLLMWLAISIAGGAAYFILFFKQFYHHDYYVICLMFLPVAITVTFLLRLKEWYPGLYFSPFSKLGLSVLIGVMFYHGIRIGKERDAEMLTEKFHEYRNIEPALNRMGINKAAKVVSLGDETTGVSLYLMNRRGWTEVMTATPISSAVIQQYLDAGAKYLFLYRDANTHLDEEARSRYLRYMIGTVNGIKIYKL